MESTSFANNHTFVSGHGPHNDQNMAAGSGSPEVRFGASRLDFRFPSSPLTAPLEGTDSQASSNTPHTRLSDRSVGKQPPPISSLNMPQSTIPGPDNDPGRDLFWIDSFRDELPTLSGTSPISNEGCGLTFKCQTSSWGNNEMALTFTSCDLRGNPSPVNDIGLQTLDVSPDRQPSDMELDERSVCMCDQLRTVTAYVRSRQLGLHCDETIIKNHFLKLGALNVETNFSIELQVNTQFPDGLPAPAGSVPCETVLFITTDSEKTPCRPEHRLESLTEIVPLNTVNQKVAVRGRNIAGEPVEQFSISSLQINRKKTRLQILNPQTTHPDYCQTLRLLVTPAVVFSASQHSEQGVASHNPSEEQLLQSCPGIEPFKLVTTAPLGNLRLLPSVIFNIVTPHSLASALLACRWPEQGFRLFHEALLAHAKEAREAEEAGSRKQDSETITEEK